MDEMFVLEQNPVDSRIMLSAGHDGYIIIWDILEGAQIKQFTNNVRLKCIHETFKYML